jgi:hypothetical protein
LAWEKKISSNDGQRKHIHVGKFALSIVLLLAAISAIAVIGMPIISVMSPNMPSLTGYSQMANTTMYSTVAAAYNAFELATVVPIVVIGAVICILLMAAFRYGHQAGAY